MYIFNKSQNRRSGTVMQKLPSRTVAGKVWRAEALDGYPKTFVFASRADVDAYLSRDNVICLLCGKEYVLLGTHIGVHGLTADQYREMYGIPSAYGLIGKSLQDDRREMAPKVLPRTAGYKQTRKPKNYIAPCDSERIKAGLRQVVKKATAASVKKITRLTEEVLAELCGLILTGLTAKAACAKQGVVTYDGLQAALKRKPEFRVMVRAALDARNSIGTGIN